MGNFSTLIYCYSNFDNNTFIIKDKYKSELKRLDRILNYLDDNCKKVPEKTIQNILEFSKKHS